MEKHTDKNDEEDEEPPIQHSNICAVYCKGDELGVASFDEESCTICADTISGYVDDVEEIIISIKTLCSPTLFLIHPKMSDNASFMELLSSSIDGVEPNQYCYKMQKSVSWNVDMAIDLICSKLIIRQMNQGAQAGLSNSRQLNYLRQSSMIDLQNNCLCQTIGALLSYLGTHVFPLDAGVITINEWKQLSLQQYMIIDRTTMAALQIFQEDQHPNVMKGRGRSKEGFSLFSFLDRTYSQAGRDRLRYWLLKPLRNKALIQHRQSGIALVVRQDNLDFITLVGKYMKHVSHFPQLILRFKKATATCQDWLQFLHSLHNGILIHSTMDQFATIQDRCEEDVAYLSSLTNSFAVQACSKLMMLLDQVIDVRESTANGVITITRGYDAQLDALRETFESLESILTQAARAVLEQVPLLQHISVDYVPQVGYFILVSEEDAYHLQLEGQNQQSDSSHSRAYTSTQEQQREEDVPFTFMYTEGGQYYFKNALMRGAAVLELDDTIGDIKSTISDKQKAILMEIEDIILECELSVQQLGMILSSLDAIIALGRVSIEYDFVKPDMVDEDVIIVKSGRHPLQELTVSQFIANDIFISPTKNISLITGANGSGKSVYLKQVGLLVYMAHIGCWLPCSKAIIGITDRIFTRINSVESVSNPHSAFSLDCGQISQMVSHHTSHSLCLMDEFGKGTSTIDGITLLATTIKHFISHKSKVVCVLHFTEVLHPNIIDITKESCILPFQLVTCQYTAAPTKRKEGMCQSTSQSQQGRDGHKSFSGLTEVKPMSDSWRGSGKVGQGLGPQPELGLADGQFDDDEDVTPLFKLHVGIASSSDGIRCASNAGISADIIKRAYQIREALAHAGNSGSGGGPKAGDDDTGVVIEPLVTMHHALLSNHKNFLLLKTFLSTDWSAVDNDSTKVLGTLQHLLQD